METFVLDRFHALDFVSPIDVKLVLFILKINSDSQFWKYLNHFVFILLMSNCKTMNCQRMNAFGNLTPDCLMDTLLKTKVMSTFVLYYVQNRAICISGIKNFIIVGDKTILIRRMLLQN